MGRLHYGTQTDAFDIEDATLAHVEIVVLAKLRRNESFALGLNGPGTIRSTLWIHPAASLQFRYETARPVIDREWLERLIESANTAGGVQLDVS